MVNPCKRLQSLMSQGRNLLCVDALEKVLGKTRYITDMIDQDVLYLRIVRSPHAHALIKKMDFSDAETIPGVVRMVTVMSQERMKLVSSFRINRSFATRRCDSLATQSP